MALIASGSRKISELTSVSGISGSTAMPIVMGGNTVQITHTNFLTTNGLIAVLNQSNTFTEQNVFIGLQAIVTGSATTELSPGSIMIYANTGNFDTFRVEVADGEGLKMQDYNEPTDTLNTFLEVGTNSGPITLFRNTTIDGDLKVDGNLTATQYIVSSSVSHITSSFSSGSTIFGDTLDDTHQFTGSVLITGSVLTNGNVTAQSFTGSLSFTDVTDKPTLVSGSTQISFNGIVDKPTLVSGSSQISFNGIIDKPTLVSGSSQIDVTQTQKYSTLATTGSNTFIGNQTITGSISVSDGEFNVITGSGVLTSSLSFTHTQSGPINGNAILELRHNNNTTVDDIKLKLIANDSGVFFDYEEDGVNFPILSVQSFDDNKLYLQRDTRLFGTDLTIDGTLEAKQTTRITGSLLVSGSGVFVSSVTASAFSGAFFGDGSGLTGVTAGAVDFDDITNKPTLFSSSIQVDADTITNFDTNVLTYIDSIGVVSGSSQVSFDGIVDKPTLVSGSSQISFDGIVDKPTLVSSSAQITYGGISNIPNSIVSSSQQVVSFLPNGTVSGSSQVSFTTISNKPTLVSGSSQISFNGIVDKPTLVSSSAQITYGDVSSIPNGIVSSSTQVLNYGIFATTGSNTFIGNQVITGSLTVSGSSTFTNIGLTKFTGSFDATGSINLTGSIVINELTYPTADFGDGQYGVEVPTLGVDNIFTMEIPKTVYEYVKNDSGGTLPKGTPVHSTGAAGFNTLVIAASASNAATMPATYILAQDLDDEEEGLGIAIGAIQGIDTTAFVAGDPVYVGADGGFTQSKPTGSNLIQNLGIVTKVGENGGGVVLGAGRSNDVPNIQPGHFLVGNGDFVPTATPTSSFATTGSNTFIGNQIVTGSFDVSGSLSITDNLVIATAGKGIDFSADGNAGGMTSELLDDYEEGTWTIGIEFGGASAGVTTSANTGTYTKIGRQVTVNGGLGLTSKGSSVGIVEITGLPFTIGAGTSYHPPATLWLNNVTFANQYQARGLTSGTKIRIEEITEAGTLTNVENTNFANNSEVFISLTYFV